MDANMDAMLQSCAEIRKRLVHGVLGKLLWARRVHKVDDAWLDALRKSNQVAYESGWPSCYINELRLTRTLLEELRSLERQRERQEQVFYIKLRLM